VSFLTQASDETERDALDLIPGTLRLVAFWEGGHTSFVLGPGARIRVGRAAECELRVEHASASRVHARLVGGEQPTIEDLASANGVSVSGTRIAPSVPTRIRPGDTIELGSVVLVVRGAPNESDPTSSAATQDRLIELVAKSSLSVVLVGETGSGKTVAAERIHRLSPRAEQPLVRLNCAAVPDGLMESELFGYERGAFTGAIQQKPGLFEAAHRGTILFDEIGEMSLAMQAKILVAVETGVVQRLGSVEPRAVDVRVIAASHQPLEKMVAEGSFRGDLYYRLNGLTITIPPLRERPHELDAFLREFLAAAYSRAGLPSPIVSASLSNALHAHAWPGNVRELKAAAERAVVLCPTGTLAIEHFGLPGAGGEAPSVAGSAPLDDQLQAFETRRIEEALAACSGNQTRAAELLGLSRRALAGRIESLGIARPRKPRG
jgi:two-component system, NtrC family, response regulator AtoC